MARRAGLIRNPHCYNAVSYGANRPGAYRWGVRIGEFADSSRDFSLGAGRKWHEHKGKVGIVGLGLTLGIMSILLSERKKRGSYRGWKKNPRYKHRRDGKSIVLTGPQLGYARFPKGSNMGDAEKGIVRSGYSGFYGLVEEANKGDRKAIGLLNYYGVQ